MNNNEREYKMRADDQSDADIIRAQLAPWLKRWQVSECHLVHEGKPLWIPDVTIEFTIADGGPTKGELKWLVNSIDGCRIAAESLDGGAEYTGERYALEDSDCIVVAPTPEKLKKSLDNLTRYRKYLDIQVERLTEARSSLEATVAIAGLSAYVKGKNLALRPRRAATKR